MEKFDALFIKVILDVRELFGLQTHDKTSFTLIYDSKLVLS